MLRKEYVHFFHLKSTLKPDEPLFFACGEEIKDLSLIEALQRLLALALDKVRSSGTFAEDVVFAMIDAIMGAAIEFIQSSRRLAKSTALKSIS